MIKTKVAFLEGCFFSTKQGFLKAYKIALIGWIKAGPPEKHFLFWSCKQANYAMLSLFTWSNKTGFIGRPLFSSQSELLENFSNCSDWLHKTVKAGPPKKPRLFWSCKQANYTYYAYSISIRMSWKFYFKKVPLWIVVFWQKNNFPPKNRLWHWTCSQPLAMEIL